jgi:hypothetical protein
LVVERHFSGSLGTMLGLSSLTLDDLIAVMGSIQGSALATELESTLAAWKDDDCTVEDLCFGVERILGGGDQSATGESEGVRSLWTSFCYGQIHGIGGMTMNERLFCFGLFSRFDACEDEHARQGIYRKLLASS